MLYVCSRKHNSGKRYRHHVTPDCNTVASLDSSSSESRSGLNRFYRQAWEDLHEAAGSGKGGRSHRDRDRDREAPKEGSELVVSDVYPRDKRRHHHHHHHREPRHPEWHPHRTHHNHKPRY